MRTEVRDEKADAICRQVAVAGLLLASAGCAPRCPGNALGPLDELAKLFGQDGPRQLPSPRRFHISCRPAGEPAANPVTAATQSVSKAFKSAGDKVASALDVNRRSSRPAIPRSCRAGPERLTPALYVQAAQLSENQGSVAQRQTAVRESVGTGPAQRKHVDRCRPLPRSPGAVRTRPCGGTIRRGTWLRRTPWYGTISACFTPAAATLPRRWMRCNRQSGLTPGTSAIATIWRRR